MSLAPGTRIGPYEVSGSLGAGGMGEVFRATDTRLGRDVALKVLPADVARDTDRRTRFEREARAVAALSHPNILAIHDIGSADDTLFVVTELLKGETLADRLRQGALPVRKAVEIAIAVARGLSAAHGKGIAHRDLKPANIFLLAGGQVKILDFGLAREMSTASGATQTQAALTDPGTVLGTAGYMAPEQIRGQPVDGRADLFALGLVLYEMLTGQRAFVRETTAETLTAILKEDPPELTATRAELPPALGRIVRPALEKNPAERFQSARDVIFALAALSGSHAGSSAQAAIRATASRGWFSSAAVAWTVAVAAMAAAVWAFWANSQRASAGVTPGSASFLAIGPPHGKFAVHASPVISPDGKRVAFWAHDAEGAVQLWIRELASPTARAVAGTKQSAESEEIHRPTFSPDGKSILFVGDAKLKRVDIDRGSPQVLADAPNPRGMTWGSEDTIVFVPASGEGLFLLPAAGGTARLLAAAPPDPKRGGPRYPHFLPDGQHFLFSDQSGIFVASVDGKVQPLLEKVSRAEYANGQLLYVAGVDLMAQPFDAATRTLSGEPRRIAEGVGSGWSGTFEKSFSASQIGTVLFWEGHMSPLAELVWLDRTGRRTAVLGPAGRYSALSAKGDLSRVAIETVNPASTALAVHVLDVDRPTPLRVTLEGLDRRFLSTPMWSPESDELWVAGLPGLFKVNTTSGRFQERWPAMLWVTDVSRDGRWVIFETVTPATGQDVWALSTADGGKPVPYLQSRFNETTARLSPDARWAAYYSNESGGAVNDIYVDAFPDKGRRSRVSVGGGISPVWAANGRALYYLTPDSRMMVADVAASGASLKVSSPRELFRAPKYNGDVGRLQFAVSADGERFLFNARLEDSIPRTINVVLNWPALLGK
jgi:dipeptidyl aminopeptidase/acylaminoacyl peptidase